MQLTENKHRRKRKSETRDQCCAWEVSDTDNGINDAFQRYQKAKQKGLQKCSYLDERNIVLSPYLFAQPRSSVYGTNDALDGPNTRWKASHLSSVPAKSSANPEENLTSAPGQSVSINPSVSTDSMIQKQNIVLSKNSMPVHIVEVSGTLPMIEWVPTSSHVHPSEETVAWRCTEFVSANHETRIPQPLWKRASGHELEWCHEHLAKAAQLGLSSPTNGPYAARPRVVIRRLARVNGGYRATLVQAGHVEQKFGHLCSYRPPANHKDLHNSYYGPSTSGAHTRNQAVYKCLCSSLQPRARHSPGGDRRDAAQILDKKDQGQQREFLDAIRVMDIQCQSGCPRNAESPPSPHHVTFSHILQVLQSKPANFPEVRGRRPHKAL